MRRRTDKKVEGIACPRKNINTAAEIAIGHPLTF
jgi:hypothetical protein